MLNRTVNTIVMIRTKLNHHSASLELTSEKRRMIPLGGALEDIQGLYEIIRRSYFCHM